MKAKLFFKKNASTILTGIGGVGVLATAVMAVKATPKAMQLIEKAKEEKGEDLTKWEVMKTTAVTYAPAMTIGVVTVGCIISANILNKRQQAALTSAYALLDQTHKQYRQKVTDIYGEDANLEIKEEIAKDDYEEADITEDEEDDGKQLFYDAFSKRYFRATNETVLRAEYEINKQVQEQGIASLNNYYDLVSLDRTDYGEYLGWSAGQMFETYWTSWIEFIHTKVDMEDGMECWIIDYAEPLIDFDEY